MNVAVYVTNIDKSKIVLALSSAWNWKETEKFRFFCLASISVGICIFRGENAYLWRNFNVICSVHTFFPGGSQLFFDRKHLVRRTSNLNIERILIPSNQHLAESSKIFDSKVVRWKKSFMRELLEN
jgi:hypothetical protein